MQRLEFHVKTLSGSREEDKKRITDLERELSNCAQEIGIHILFDIYMNVHTHLLFCNLFACDRMYVII